MTVSKDKVISFDYTLRESAGGIIDGSESQPMVYLHGHGNIIPGLERALEGKAPGDNFAVCVSAADGYGEWDNELVATVPRSSFDESIVEELTEGAQFRARVSAGNSGDICGTTQVATVLKISGEEVTVDLNHPLAGVDLIFDVTIREIRDAGEEEIERGRVIGGCQKCRKKKCPCLGIFS